MFAGIPRRGLALIATAAVALTGSVVASEAALAAPATGSLLISEMIEGSSNNKAIEIHNPTSAAVDLGAGGYALQYFFNGSATAGNTINLTGSIAAGGTHVVAHGSASAAILAKAQQTNSASWYNGDDAIVLKSSAGTLDVIGQIGVDPGTEWGSGLVSTADNTLRRKASVCAGRVDGSTLFDPAVEWDGFATDATDGLGAHTSTCGDDTDPGDPGEPSATCGTAYATIPAIQGSGDSAALTGIQATEGIVVADHEGPSPKLRGFYLQDAAGDGDPATADGMFVFNGNNDSVAIGDKVRVIGAVAEFQGQTQLSVTTLSKCGTGTVAPTPVTLPFASVTDAERYEGMLVTFPEALSVTEHYQLGRFGQVTLSGSGRLQQPTNVVAPGDEALAMQAANNLNKILLDDSTQAQNPDPIVWARGGQPLSAANTLRGGDTVTGAIGVMTWTWGGNSASPNAWRLRPIGALGGQATFEPANPRPTAVPDVGGTTTVAGMNLLNYFNTFGAVCTGGVGGAPMDCRGADNQAEFERQYAKTVAAILAIDTDVVGINEMENDGYGASSAIAHLVDQLNARTAPGTWAFIDVDARTGQTDAMGADAIKVGQLYQPARVTPVGATAVLNSTDFVNGGDSSPRNRPSLAQAYRTSTGATFIADINHLKSKGSECETPDLEDGQGNCSIVRTRSAELLAQWLASDPTGTGDPDVLLIGDYNSYAKEKPIQALEAAGYTNLITSFEGPDSYSYVFDGQWGNLDHALGSASLTRQVTGVHEFHINSDEPAILDYNTNFKSPGQVASLYAPDMFRVSDHDPVVIGLALDAPPPTVSASGPYAVDEGGSVTLTATGEAGDGGAPPAYAWDLDGDGTFETDGATVTFSAAGLDGPTTRTVTVRATNGSGVTATATAEVSIANVAPTASAAFGTGVVDCRRDAGITVTFSDPGAPDTHTVVIAWGDGTSETVTSATSPLTRTHAYAASGPHTASVTVTDDDGASVSTSATAATAYQISGFAPPLGILPVTPVSRFTTVPVKTQILDCDGRPATGINPTVTVTSSNGVVWAQGPLSVQNKNWRMFKFTPTWWPWGTYTVRITVPETGQSISTQIFVV